MGVCGPALRVAAGAPRAALRPLEVGWLRLRGGGFASVICMAMIRDSYPAAEAARRFPVVMLVMLSAPVGCKFLFNFQRQHELQFALL